MSLVKEGCDIDENVKEENPSHLLIQLLLDDISDLCIDTMQLKPESRKVTIHIAGYIAMKFKGQKNYSCCLKSLVGILSPENPEHSYIKFLNRGGLTITSSDLTDYVCTAFAILDSTESLIRSSGLPTRKAATTILKDIFDRNIDSTPQFACTQHQVAARIYADRVITNIFFNNRRYILTTDNVKNEVADFKKPKRGKKGK